MPLTAVPAALIPEGQNRIIGDIELLAGARIARLAGVSAGLLSNLPADVFLGNLYTSPAPARDFAAVDIAGIGISYDTAIGNGPFPKVIFRGTVSSPTSATSHNVAIPTTTVGDRVTIAIWTNQAAQVVTTPTGFTLLGKVETTDGEADVYERVFTGSGDPVTPAVFALSVTSSLLARVWNTRYSDASKPSEIVSTLQNSAVGTTNDLPNLTQTWSTANTLYLFFIGIEVDVGPPNITVFPGGLTNTGQDQIISATAAVDGAIGYGEILSRANSLDLPACTYGPGRSGAFLIAVPPRPSGALNWEGLQVTGGNATTGRLTQLSFSNANGVSFGLSGSTLTASVGAGGAAGSIAVPGSTLALGQVVFSNANGVSFGLNGSTMTASVAGGAFGGIAGGTQTATTGTVVFSNQNGISFGLSGSSRMTASYTVPALGSISAGTTSAALGLVAFSNSNNVSFGMNGSTITASVTVAPPAASSENILAAGTQTATPGTVLFSNLNNVSFGMSGSSRITASFALNLSAGTTSNNLSAFTVNNGNGVSFGLNGSVLTASIASSLTAINVSAGTTSNNLSALTFSNLNGVTFGLNGSVITASVAGGGGITGINVSAGTTSNNLTAFTLANANNVSFGLNGSVLTAIATVASTQGSFTVSAGGSSALINNLVFTNANNVGFALSTAAGSVATIRAAASFGLSAGTTNANVSQVSFSHATATQQIAFNTDLTGNVEFFMTGSSISARAAIRLSGGTTAFNGTLFSFGNANNVSFGISSNFASVPVITASIDDNIGMISHVGVTSIVDVSRIAFSNNNNVSWTLSTGANAVTIQAQIANPGLLAASAGTTLLSSQTLIFSNLNGVSFGLNGATLTASVAAGGGGGLQALSAGTQLNSTGTVNLVSNAVTSLWSGNDNVFFGMSNSSLVTANAVINVGGNTTGNGLPMTRFDFMDAGAVTWNRQSTTVALGNVVMISAGLVASSVGALIRFAGDNDDVTGGSVDPFTLGANDTSVRFTPATNLTIGGIAADTGRTITIYVSRTATNTVTLTHNGAGTATNSIFCPGNIDLVLKAGDAAILRYEFSRWVVVSTSQLARPQMSMWRNWSENDIVNQQFTNLSDVGRVFPLGIGPFPADMTVNTLDIGVSGSGWTGTQGTNQWGLTIRGGLYTLNNSTRLSLLNSFSVVVSSGTITSANSASRNALYAGGRWLTVGTANWSAAPVLAYGSQYWMMINYIATGLSLPIGSGQIALIRAVPDWQGVVSRSQSNNIGGAYVPFLGVLSGTTAPPASIGATAIFTGTALTERAFPTVQFRNGIFI